MYKELLNEMRQSPRLAPEFMFFQHEETGERMLYVSMPFGRYNYNRDLITPRKAKELAQYGLNEMVKRRYKLKEISPDHPEYLEAHKAEGKWQ